VTDLGKLAQAAPAVRPAPSIDNPKPWDEAKAVIKLKNGKSVTVDAKTLSTNYTSWCGVNGLNLDYGQSIPFKNMQSLSVLDETPSIEVVPLNGEHLRGHVKDDCDITANNEFGSFEANVRTIERVDFDR
jgi:hypothetical protein